MEKDKGGQGWTVADKGRKRWTMVDQCGKGGKRQTRAEKDRRGRKNRGQEADKGRKRWSKTYKGRQFQKVVKRLTRVNKHGLKLPKVDKIVV